MSQSAGPEEESVKPASRRSFGSWIKRNAAMVGAAALGFAGTMDNAHGSDLSQNEAPAGGSAIEQSELAWDPSDLFPSDHFFDICHIDKETVWGIDQVPAKDAAGKSYYRLRYVKIDNATRKVETIAEYGNFIEAYEGISKIPGVPESVVRNAASYLKPILEERAFQASGLVENEKPPIGPTHIEKRDFKGYGIEVENTVKVDSKGNVVELVGSADLSGSGLKRIK